MMHKRRRISFNKSTPTATAAVLHLISTPSKTACLLPSTTSTCVSCHRALNTRTSCPITCSCCGSLTCMVCSRRCTSPPSGAAISTPSRAALSLQSQNTGAAPSSAISSHKRKKHEDERADKSDDDDGSRGCGRIICRDCCVENVQSDTTTCTDCINRSLIPK